MNRARLVVAMLALLAACAHATAPQPPPSAAAILSATTAAYKGASSYVDTGSVAIVLTGDHPQTIRGTFATAKGAGGKLRFEYRDDQKRHDLVLWSDGTDAVIAKDGQSVHSEREWGLDPASQLALTFMLRHVGDVGDGGAALAAPVVQGVEAIGGHACWRIAGDDGETTGTRDTLWIDQRDAIVRKVEVRSKAHGMVGTIVYAPVINAALEAAQLAPPAVESHEPQWVGVGFHPSSALIDRVYDGSPAAKAGFVKGDEIATLDGKPVSGDEFRATVAASKPGAQFTVVVHRAGADVTLHVAPAPRPELSALQQGLVGKPAPTFALAPLAGTFSPKLADLAGDVVVVDFWATWCGPCAYSMPHLDELHRKFAASGLRIIGITDEDAADVAAFLKARPVGYTIASDPDNAVAGAYLVQGLPTLMIVDRAGVIRYSQVGVGDFSALDAKIAELVARPGQPAKPSNLPP